MAMSQALGIAELIARSDLETNSAITAMRNGINATKPLAERRDSSEMGKLAPSPTINAIASHDPRKAAIIKGDGGLGSLRQRSARSCHSSNGGMRGNNEDGNGEDHKSRAAIKKKAGTTGRLAS